mgnify:CR=1 FL=1
MNITDSANKNSTRLNAEPIQLNLEKKNGIIQKKINIVRSPKAAMFRKQLIKSMSCSGVISDCVFIKELRDIRNMPRNLLVL